VQLIVSVNLSIIIKRYSVRLQIRKLYVIECNVIVVKAVHVMLSVTDCYHHQANQLQTEKIAVELHRR